ncbi:MAG: hypothetical protein WBA28_02230 [Microbacteriaceae bacterium]
MKLRLGRENIPFLVVLFLIGLFQVFRGQWVDTAIFAFAVLLALFRPPNFRSKKAGIDTHLGTPSLGALVPIALAIGVLLFFSERHGAFSGVVIVSLGVVVLSFAWFSGGSRPVASPNNDHDSPQKKTQIKLPVEYRRAKVVWITLVLVLGLWEASSYLAGRWFNFNEMPSISDLLDPALNTALGKIVFLALWLAIGVWLLRRGGKHA